MKKRKLRSTTVSTLIRQGIAVGMVVSILLVLGAMPVRAATQSISGDPIDIDVHDTGRIEPYYDNWASGYQYYSADACNNVLWLNSGSMGFDCSGASTADCSSCTDFTPISNSKPDAWTIVTVYEAGSTGIRITQTVTYTDGAKYYNMEWVIENTGSTTYTDLYFIRGGDTYFGGLDSSNGHYDSSLDMVYLTNSGVTGIMGLLGTTTSPIDHYYEDTYSSVTNAMNSGSNLPDTVDPNYVDAGYAVEWDRATLSPGETWEIKAIEKWTESGDVQVMAPAGQSGNVGDTFTYDFTVQNLQSSSDTFDLSVSSSQGWDVSLPGGNTVTIGAGSSATVQVQVTATSAGTDMTTLTATSQSDSTVTNDDSVTTEANALPTADANGPYSGNVGESITLDGTGSSDPDGSIASYAWDLDNDGSYDDATGSQPTHSWSTAGTHTIGLEVTDDDGATDTTTATVDVNDPPTANDESVGTDEDTAVTIDVLANDTDSDGTLDPSTVTVTGGPSHGSTSVNTSTGEITYTPDPNYHGTDSFTYTVDDDDGSTSNEATVTISVADVNDPPTANDESVGTDEDTAVTIDVLANDTDSDGTLDPSTVTVTGGPSHGSTSVNTSTGEITYTPDPNYHGTDSFTYTVDDDDGSTSNEATVTISVADVNDPPTASFSYSPAAPRTGQTIAFDASASFDSDGTIAVYEWDWTSDGTFDSTGMTTTHYYSAVGDHQVTLQVTDDDGGVDTFTLELAIASAINPVVEFEPVALFHLWQVNTCLGCIEKYLPEEVPNDVQDLLDEMQMHLDNANTTQNTIYANNELLKALECAEEIQEKLGIECL